MQFAQPFALFWFGLALPLVALYLLRVRPRPRTVSTVLFWREAIPESRPRRWWQRLRHPLSLLLQLLLLVLLVMALAEPRGLDAQTGRLLLVVLDNSASMRATDVVPNRLSVAKRHVQRLIDAMGPRDQLALITAGTTAELRVGVTSQRRSLRRAVAEVQPTDGPNRLRDALALARRLHDPLVPTLVFVVTDPAGQLEADGRTDDAAERWVVFGQATDNLAITQFQARRQLLDPTGLECLVEVTSFAAHPRGCRLRIELNGQLQDVIPLELQPHQSHQQVLPYTSAEGGILRASLEVSDALAVDNQAVACLAPRPPRHVLLVTPGNLYLEKVLAALPLVQLDVVEQLPAEPPRDVLPILHAVPVERLPVGRSMLVQPVQDHPLWQLGPPQPDAVIGMQKPRSPLLAHLQLEELPVAGVRSLQLPNRADVLAATLGGDPVCAIVPHERGEVLLLNVDLQSGDFAWRTAFPVLMSNALNWLAGQSATFQAAYAAGDVVPLDELAGMLADSSPSTDLPTSAAARARSWQLESPRGQLRWLTTDGQGGSLGPLDQAGVWTLRRGATAPEREGAEQPPALQLACNVVSRAESDLRSEPTNTARSASTMSAASISSAGQPLWFYLVAAGLLLAAAEWWLYQRRWTS